MRASHKRLRPLRIAHWLSLAAVGFLLVGPLGCGDDSSVQIRLLIERAQQLSAARDRATLCEEIISPLQFSTPGKLARCRRHLPITSRPDAPLKEVDSVQIDGETARATLEDGGYVDVVQVDGRWYIDIAS